jgi:hypothetical protein
VFISFFEGERKERKGRESREREEKKRVLFLEFF